MDDDVDFFAQVSSRVLEQQEALLCTIVLCELDMEFFFWSYREVFRMICCDPQLWRPISMKRCVFND